MGTNTNNLGFSLFAKPSFFEGMARVVDLGGTLQVYNESADGKEADYLALFSDWVVTGDDMRAAMSQYEQEKEI